MLLFRERLDELDGLWKQLVDQTGRKGAKLKDASDQQSFNRNVEDVEVWLAEIEGQLMSEDYGKVRQSLYTEISVQERLFLSSYVWKGFFDCVPEFLKKLMEV